MEVTIIELVEFTGIMELASIEAKEKENTMDMETVIDYTCERVEEKELFRAVIEQIGDWSAISEYPEDYRDASAGASGFIYYADTEEFAKKHCANINSVLWAFEDEMGCSLEKDTDQPWNWLAWFALEHVIQKVMDYKEDN